MQSGFYIDTPCGFGLIDGLEVDMKGLLFVFGILGTLAFGDGFECKNRGTGPTPRWSAKTFNSRTAGEGRVPALLYVSNGKRGGTIVREDDRRRLQLSGKEEHGAFVTLKLNSDERRLLSKLADNRLSRETLDSVAYVELWVSYEQNEPLLKTFRKNGELRRRGYLTLTNSKEEELYSYRLDCDYNPADQPADEE